MSDKTVTLAQLTERFGLPASQQQGVYAWTNAHGDPSGDSPLWTEDEARELLEVWNDDYAASVEDGTRGPDMVQVEYSAEGGETIHEADQVVTEARAITPEPKHIHPPLDQAEAQLSAYVANHSMCGEPGFYCPTQVHPYIPLKPGGSY